MLKLTKELFIEKANVVHNNEYDYSLVEYVNGNTKVKIICKKHDIFKQTPNNHIYHATKCLQCQNEKRQLTTESFIFKSIEKHGIKYNYILVKYVDSYTKVEIICNEHGIFKQRPNDHLNGCGCKKCSNKTIQLSDFINRSNKVHNNFYDYKLVEYKNNYSKVKIICPTHKIFEQRPKDHLNNNGCPICKLSKGELEIKKILKLNNIKFNTQQKFNNCKHKQLLSFDFYLPDKNLCIEFDGRQHYESIEKWGGMKYLKDQQIKDKIKNIYCIENNINLLRIKYNDNIENKLKEYNIV